MTAEIRLALTLPGAVSLGAFEAGAVAALGVGLGALAETRDHPGAPTVRLDVIGAASAGALTGLLLARSLLEGGDPVAPQEQSWVRDASLRMLVARGWSTPLSYRVLRRRARALLEPPPEAQAPAQSEPVRFTLALTNLRGLAYRLPTLTVTGPPVVSHLDWIDLRLEAGVPTVDLLKLRGGSIVDAVLASAAHQLGFPPVLLSRASDRARYEADGVVNFPSSEQFWYADAAPLDREPLARTLRLARQVDDDEEGDFRRVHLLVRPQPQRAGTGDAWADPRARPRWTQVLGRSVAIQQEQSIFDDLSGIEDTNGRLAAVDHLATSLAPLLARASFLDQENFRAALAGLKSDHSGSAGESVEELLRDALSAAANVTGKHRIGVETISPPEAGDSSSQPDGGGPATGEALAGAGLFRFAGFLDERFRRHDFAVGYESALRWLADGGLTRHGLTTEQSEAMIAAVTGRRPPRVRLPERRLTLGARWAAVRLLARLGLVALHDVVLGPRGADDVRRASASTRPHRRLLDRRTPPR
jgi:hypothetical protein